MRVQEKGDEQITSRWIGFAIESSKSKNLGATVTLIKFHGELWEIAGNLDSSHSQYLITTHFLAPPEWLMPLGDDKGIELYKLQEELVEEQSQ